jgi:hypothetical protein
MTTDSEKLEALKIANRKRVSKWYQNHKVEINEKKRLLYRAGKECLENNPDKFTVEQHLPEHESKSNSEPETEPETEPESKEPTYDNIMHFLQNKEFASESTRKTYISGLKSLHKLFNASNYKTQFEKYKQTIYTINTSKKSNGDPYSTNSLKSVFQTILYLSDNFDGLKLADSIKQKYKLQFDVSKVISSEIAEDKKTLKIPTFNEYIDEVVKKFGKGSKLFVIASMAMELALRDDFGLKIVENETDANDKDENYLIKTVKGPMKVIVNQYKTSKKYGANIQTMSSKLSTIVRKYIEDNGIKTGSLLFGVKKLTSFISSENKKLGFSGGINLFREMIQLNEKKSPESKVQIANQLKHSVPASINYKRNK